MQAQALYFIILFALMKKGGIIRSNRQGYKQMKNFFPPEHHDFVGTSEIRREAARNKEFLEAKYLGDVGVFRADIFLKLGKVGAIGQNGGWAVYRIQTQEESSSLVETGSGEVLIHVSYPTIAPAPLRTPTIRMLTNELYLPLSGENHQNLTQDIIVDYEGDAQYYVSAINQEQDVNFDNSFAVIFVAEENRLGLSRNFRAFPPMPELYSGEKVVRPFGHYSNLDDKIYALEAARSVFEAIQISEPSAYSAA
jgi:hypothetical protein